MKMPKYTVDQVQLAEILGVNKKTISRAVDRGRLNKSVMKTAQGRYEIDLVAAIFEWFGNADLSKDRGNRPQHDVQQLMEMQESRRIKEHYAALLEKLHYEKEKELLLSREQTEKEVFDAFRTTRDKLRNIPNGSCHQLSAENDPQKIRTFLEAEIDKALMEVTNLRKERGSDPHG